MTRLVSLRAGCLTDTTEGWGTMQPLNEGLYSRDGHRLSVCKGVVGVVELFDV